jgi:hypothetical protein
MFKRYFRMKGHKCCTFLHSSRSAQRKLEGNYLTLHDTEQSHRPDDRGCKNLWNVDKFLRHYTLIILMMEAVSTSETSVNFLPDYTLIVLMEEVSTSETSVNLYEANDRGSKHLWNVGKLLPEYVSQHPKDTRLHSRRLENLKSHA